MVPEKLGEYLLQCRYVSKQMTLEFTKSNGAFLTGKTAKLDCLR